MQTTQTTGIDPLFPDILRKLCDLLPYTGEDGYASSQAGAQIHAALLDCFPDAEKEVEAAMTFCLLLFRSAGVLDLDYLENGKWRFASCASRIFAISALRLLLRSAKDGNFSLSPLSFWRDTDDAVRQRRHQLLEFMAESLSRDTDEPAVRIIHVSFALLRCGDYFLCHERELAPADPDRVRKGALVLPGGRLNAEDMPAALSQQEKLCLLSSPDGLGQYAAQAHERAMRRELAEELRLTPDMYHIAEFTHFRPYRGRYGGGDNHAWTETSIRLYEVTLKPESASVLQPYFRPEYAGHWACAKELWQSRNELGEKIFFDACRENMPSAAALLAARESFPFLHGQSAPQNVLALSGDTALRVDVGPLREEGKAGRPKNPISVSLNEEQSQLLLALGLAQRLMAWPREQPREEHELLLQQTKKQECAAALGGLLLHSSALRKLYASLPEAIRRCCFAESGYYRLNDRIFFPAAFFSYHVEEAGHQEQPCLCIHRKEVDLPLLGISCPALCLRCDLPGGALDIFRGVRREGSYDTLRTAKDRQSGKKLEDRVRDIGLGRLYDNKGNIDIPARWMPS